MSRSRVESVLLFARTIRHLRARQALNRVTRRLVPPRIDLRQAPASRPSARPLELPFLGRPVSYLGDGSHRYLNERRSVEPARFSRRHGSLLWDYNLNYFDGLFSPEPSEAEKRAWIDAWIDAVPAGSRPAWDPYPTSRRLCNWIKWVVENPERDSPAVRDSLAAQARYLDGSMEYHLMANHLLANAVAITMAGLYFGGPEGERWLRSASRLLEAELQEQILPGGAHYELSPVYHSLILEDLLDLVQVARSRDVELPARIAEAIRAAVGWLAAVVRPDGAVPLFNDAAYGLAPEPDALLAYADALGLRMRPDGSLAGLRLLGDSGYFRYERARLWVLGDIGTPGPSYQPGHAHCDLLSFELCWEGKPIVVDTGTSTYNVGDRRSVERGTAAHNTVQVGGLEQSEIWAAFRMARRARVDDVRLRGDEVAARIRAFPPRWARLERRWRFDGERVAIDDHVADGTSDGSTNTARLHFHPAVSLSGQGREWRAGGLRLTFRDATDVREESYLYAPEFNRLVPGRCLAIEFTRRMTTTIEP